MKKEGRPRSRPYGSYGFCFYRKPKTALLGFAFAFAFTENQKPKTVFP
jgi:hypothetical protein